MANDTAPAFRRNAPRGSWGPSPDNLRRAYIAGYEDVRARRPWRDYSADAIEQGRYELGRQAFIETFGCFPMPAAIHEARGVQTLLRMMHERRTAT